MTSRSYPPRQRSFILHYIAADEAQDTEVSQWQFCLKEVQTGQQYVFSDLDSLSRFLRQMVNEQNNSDQDE